MGPAGEPRAEGAGGEPGPSPRAVLAGVLALVALVHLPLVRFGFVYDDWWTLVLNGFLRAPELSLLWSPRAAELHVPDAFRPTLVALDLVSYRLFGVTAALHHALSIALHVGVCALAGAWLGDLGAPLRLRAATVALFGLLAIHAEAVAVVSFREDLLAALLGLSALRVASRAARGGRAWRWALATLLMTAACGAKMSAAALPALWLLCELLHPWDRQGISARKLTLGAAVLLAGALLVLAHTALVFGRPTPYEPTDPRLYAARVGAGPVLWASAQIHLGYLQQIAAPFGLSPEYADRGARPGEPATILALASLASLAIYGLWSARRRRRPLSALVILGALALAVPTSNLAAMPNMRADRFVYLTSLPVCLGLAALGLWWGRALARRFARPWLELAPITVYCVVQGAVMLASCHVYRSGAQLWTSAVARAPGSARAQALYAESLLARARGIERGTPERELLLARIEARCRSARRLDPLDALSHLCSARLALARRQWEAADTHLRRALELAPDHAARILVALAHNSLDLPGLPAATRKRRARALIDEGLAAYPFSPELRAAAGRIAHVLGDPALAAEHYAQARTLAPERVQTALWRLELALDRGDLAGARQIWQEDRQWLDRAPAGTRMALKVRTDEAARLFPSQARAAMLSDGVAPDAP